MKVLKRIGVLVLIMLFLMAGFNCGGEQTAREEHYDKGIEHGIQGEFKAAKVEFEKALKIDSFFVSAKISLSIVEDIITQKINRQSAIHLFKGREYTKKMQLDSALVEFNESIKTNPENAYAYNSRGWIYLNRGWMYLKNMGWINLNKGLYDQAISDFNKAIEINPRFAEAYYCRGLAYTNKGNFYNQVFYDQAISDHTKAIELNHNFAEAYSERGSVYNVKGHYKEAISDFNKAISEFNKAIQVNPRNAFAYYLKARTYEMIGHVGATIEAYKVFIQNALTQDSLYVKEARRRIRELEE